MAASDAERAATMSTEWLIDMVATMGIVASKEWMNPPILDALARVLSTDPVEDKDSDLVVMVMGARIAVRVFQAMAREMEEANAMLAARRERE